MSSPWTPFEEAVAALRRPPMELTELAAYRQQLLRLRDEAIARVLKPAKSRPQKTRGELLVDSLKRVRLRRRAARMRVVRQWDRTLRAPVHPGTDQELTAIKSLWRQRDATRLVPRPPRRIKALNDDQVGLLDEVPGRLEQVRRLGIAMSSGSNAGSKQSFVGFDAEYFQYAVNDVKIYTEGFGQADDILADVASLGASVIRHPGRNLTFPYVIEERKTVTSGDDDYEIVVLPLAGELTGKIAQFRSKLAQMLLAIAAQGLSVVLTLVHPGASVELTVEITLDGAKKASVRQAIAVVWADEHEDAELDGASWGAYPLVGLDVRSEYQLQYLEIYVRRICLLLKSIESQYFNLAGLDAVVAGVELFNEVDIRNILPSSSDPAERYGTSAAEETGVSWASALYRLAVVARDVLGGEIPIMLPGLSSFNLTTLGTSAVEPDSIDYTKTWTWQKYFIKAMFDQFAALYEADVAAGRLEYLDPKQIAAIQDLHWYHKSKASGSNIGPLHVGRLNWTHEQLRDILDVRRFDYTLITVFEQGVSANENTDDFVAPAAPDVETWQAWEVWRRLAGALAAGASVAGWHCWRSLTGGTFEGTGLRRQVTSAGAFATPDEAYQRKAWFAYQRFVSILRYPTSVSYQLPLDASGSNLVKVDMDSPAAQDVVVVAFKGVFFSPDTGAIYPYAYLVFVDPWRQTADTVDTTYDLDITHRSGASVKAQRVATIPWRITKEPGANSDTLPQNAATFSLVSGRLGSSSDVVDVEISTSGSRWKASSKSGPQLLLAQQHLTWSLA